MDTCPNIEEEDINVVYWHLLITLQKLGLINGKDRISVGGYVDHLVMYKRQRRLDEL